MNQEPKKEEIPVGKAAAYEALRKKIGNRPRSYQSIAYRLLGVNNIFVEECFAISYSSNKNKK